MQYVKQYLIEHQINFKEFIHPAVFTCEEAEKYSIYHNIKGVHCKNLFLKDKKSKNFYLVILSAKQSLDLEKIDSLTNQKIKFANENDLKEILELTTGAVSPFGLINDKEHKVKVLIDKQIMNSDFVSFHPNINTSTLELSKTDFKKYLDSLKNEIIII